MPTTKTTPTAAARPALNPAHFVALRLDGVTVFHTLRWCNRIKRDFWFTLDPAAIDGEARYDMRGQFDARELPAQYRQGQAPAAWIQRALLDGFDLATLVDADKARRELTTDDDECPF